MAGTRYPSLPWQVVHWRVISTVNQVLPRTGLRDRELGTGSGSLGGPVVGAVSRFAGVGLRRWRQARQANSEAGPRQVGFPDGQKGLSMGGAVFCEGGPGLSGCILPALGAGRAVAGEAGFLVGPQLGGGGGTLYWAGTGWGGGAGCQGSM